MSNGENYFMEVVRPAFLVVLLLCVGLFDSFSQICTFSYIHINIYYVFHLTSKVLESIPSHSPNPSYKNSLLFKFLFPKLYNRNPFICYLNNLLSIGNNQLIESSMKELSFVRDDFIN